MFNVRFPMGQTKIFESDGILKDGYIVWEPGFSSKFNGSLTQTQTYLDNLVIQHLQQYVSKKTGTQERSVRFGSKPGDGEVWIAVPYAEYQAYSPRIRKMVGLRGPKPFERMKADKKDEILRQVSAYSRRLNS